MKTASWVVLFALGATACGGGRDHELLRHSWDGYRRNFVTAEGRVVRPEHGGDTVSEAQAYTMLRAAWMDDQTTFDLVWSWTRTHLSRDGLENEALLGWHWSPAGGGHVVDWNVATDADADVALALLLAAARWSTPSSANQTRYGDDARSIIEALMDHAGTTDGRRLHFLLPGAWADQRADGHGLVLNPSYFSPASYRLFYGVTGDRRWLSMVSAAYDALDALCADAHGVIPDWVRWLSVDDWAVDGLDDGPRSSWDAVRVPWRVATDLLWFDEPRARRFLERCVEPFVREQISGGRGLAVEYSLTGQVLGADDHPLANALFAFALSNTTERNALLERVERRVVKGAAGAFFGEPHRYYVNSLAYLPFLVRAGGYDAPGSAY